MHRRFVCSDCHLKWYASAADDEPTHCNACGGVLVPLPAPAVVRREDDSARTAALDRSERRGGPAGHAG